MATVFFVLSWILPNHYPPWVNFHSEFLAFLGLGMLAFTALKNSQTFVAVPKVAVAILVLAALPWLQYIAGLVFYAGDAFVSSFYSAGLAVAVAVGYALSLQPNRITEKAWLLPAYVLSTAAVVSSVIAVLQWLSLTDQINTFVAVTDIGDRAMANLGQPNQLGSLLLMGMVGLVLLFEFFKISGGTLCLATSLLTWSLVLTGSRTAMLSAAVIVLFLAFKTIECRKAGTLLRLTLTYLLLWSATYALAIFALPFINDGLLLSSGRDIKLMNANGRVAIWLQTLYAIAESPWLGYGWNQTPVAQAAGVLHHPGELTFTNAHNIVLDVLAWVGLPLGLVITLAFLYWLVTRLTEVRNTGAVYAAAMLLIIIVHSMLEFPFAYAYFLLMAGLLMGVIEAAHPTATATRISKRLPIVVLAVLAMVGCYSAYEYVLIEEDYRVARFENLRVGQTEEGYVRPNILIHTQLGDLLTALRQPAVREMEPIKLERLRKVSLRFGFRPLVFRYALALGLNSQPAAATQEMLKFRSMFGLNAYQRFKSELRRLQVEKYPELAVIDLP